MQSLSKTAALNFLKSLPWAAEKILSKEYIRIIRRSICYNQGKLANFTFEAERKHQCLQSFINELPENKSRITDQQIEKLQDKVRSLSDYLNTEIRESYESNFVFIQDFLNLQKRAPLNKKPRIYVKVIREKRVLSIARDSYDFQPDKKYLSSENSAFSWIEKTGKYYICNNIPKKVKERGYRNPRISSDSVISFYKTPGIIQNFRFKNTSTGDIEWPKHWEKVNAEKGEYTPEIRTCYKSTLVIPMTMINTNSNLGKPFRSYFSIDYHNKRTGFGFLCLDHVNTGFFNEDEDIDVGYIFSDILSLYIVQQLTFTNYSPKFRLAQDILRQAK